MIRVDESQIFTLGAHLHPLTELKGPIQLGTCATVLYRAKKAALKIMSGIFEFPLPVCVENATRLWDLIEPLIPEQGVPNFSQQLETWNVQAIARAAMELETVFMAEARTIDTYYVSQKGIYSTRHLIESAENGFPEKIRKDMPAQAIQDFREAGKAIVLDLPTAAVFHLMRAMESVILFYLSSLDKTPVPARMRNWGVYIDRLKKVGADVKVTAFLQHIKDHHRNPVLHPDVNVTEEDALVLFGAANSAITQIVSAVQAIPPGTQLMLAIEVPGQVTPAV